MLSNGLIERFQVVDRSFVKGDELRMPGQNGVFAQGHLEIAGRNVGAVEQFKVVTRINARASFKIAHVISRAVVVAPITADMTSVRLQV